MVEIHKSAGHGLPIYHFGGDEVAHDAWKGSPICQEFMRQRPDINNNDDLKKYFLYEVAKIVASKTKQSLLSEVLRALLYP